MEKYCMWNKDEESYCLSASSRAQQSALVYSDTDSETLTTDSSVPSLAFFFAFFRLLRSLSSCLALFISVFDRPGLLMSSSYTTHHYYLCQGR